MGQNSARQVSDPATGFQPPTMEDMTENEWRSATEPYSMLAALRKTSLWDEAKVRQFACWCARQMWHFLGDIRSRQAVELAEKFAAGRATFEELAAAETRAIEAEVCVEESGWDMTSAAERTAVFEVAHAARMTATTMGVAGLQEKRKRHRQERQHSAQRDQRLRQWRRSLKVMQQGRQWSKPRPTSFEKCLTGLLAESNELVANAESRGQSCLLPII
jgi:hypothetical protein